MDQCHWKNLFQLRALTVKAKSLPYDGSPSELRVLRACRENIDEAYAQCLDLSTQGREVPK